MYVRNLSLNVAMTGIDKKFDQILNKKKAYEKKIKYWNSVELCENKKIR